MQTAPGKSLSTLVLPLVLTACGGGGGDSATPLAWDGLGQEVSYVYDTNNQTVTSIGTPSDVTGNYSTRLTFDAGVLTGMTIRTPTTTMSFASYEIFAVSPEIIWATNATSNALLANHIALGWDYQTFGVWETGLDTSQGAFGAFSVGNPTSTSVVAIPGIDGATFIGKAAGGYVNTAGVGHAVLADLSVTANFSGATPSLGFTTSNTQVSTDWTSFTSNTDLNLSGTLYVTGTNSFTGSVATSGPSVLSGTSSGQFYGPNAEELGGVFFLQGNGETYTGAYGAAR